MADDPRQAAGDASPRSAWLFPAVALGLAVLAGIAWVVVRPGPAESMPEIGPSAVETSAGAPAEPAESSITFNFDERSPTPYSSARVTVSRGTAGAHVAVSLEARSTRTETARYESRITSDEPWSGVVDKYLQFALVPGYAKSVSSLNGRSIQVAWLSGVDLSVLAIERDPARSAEAFFWSDYSGEVRNSRNDVLPSATVSAGSYAVTVFEDAQLGVWGYFDGIVNKLEPISTQPVRKLRVTGVSVASDGLPAKRRAWFGMLPAGARVPRLTTDASVTWNDATLGSTGRLVIAGYNEDVRRGGTGVHRISYVDASGHRRSFTP